MIPVSDKIENLHDWLLLPLEMRRNSAGAAVVLGEIAASHADLLAAAEAVLVSASFQEEEANEQGWGHVEIPRRDIARIREAVAKAKGA
jgi:hypothetical protein